MRKRELIPISDSSTSGGGTARKLVILIPGMGSTHDDWKSLIERLQGEADYGPALADWMSFEHGISLLTPGDLRAPFRRNPRLLGNLERLARLLCDLIYQQWEKHGGYDDVVLIGHSFGGLLARRIYLLATGAVPNVDAFSWGEKTSRIVLFAAVNRGFSLESLSWAQRTAAGLLRAFSRRIFYAEDCLQGSDFVTNLRIDWIRYFRAMDDQELGGIKPSDVGQIHLPLVVQFLGDQDETLTAEDSKDIMAFPNGQYIPIADGNHQDLFRLEKKFAFDPDGRYAVIRKAFVGTPESVITESHQRSKESPIQRVVMVLHGIRADNVDSWITGLQSKIKKCDPDMTVVSAPTYGYFSALRFALPLVRRKNVPIFRDDYTELLAKHPKAEFNIIAHSNGTYMLGHSLEKTPGMRFQNVVLAGSALPEDYDWASLQTPDARNDRQVGRILNERSSRDVPIGVLCNMLHALPMRDIGRAGFAGFRGAATTEFAYHDGGHSQALIPANQDRLVEFVFSREPGPAHDQVEDPGYFRQLSEVSRYLGWPVIVAILLLMGFISFPGGVFNPIRAVWAVVALIVLLVFLDSL